MERRWGIVVHGKEHSIKTATDRWLGSQEDLARNVQHVRLNSNRNLSICTSLHLLATMMNNTNKGKRRQRRLVYQE